MPTTLSVEDAQTRFSGELAREIRPLPGYGSEIRIIGDIFADGSRLWENA